MIRKLPLTLALALTAVLVLAPAAMAGQKLTGSMALDWNDGWSGPSDVIPDWVGTVDFDGDVYPMVFFNVGTGKNPRHNPGGKAAFFEEYWAVYEDNVTAVWDGSVFIGFEPAPTTVLYGYDKGQFNAQTSRYHMSGYIMTAAGPFEGLEGQRITMRGALVGGNTAPGVIRIH